MSLQYKFVYNTFLIKLAALDDFTFSGKILEYR